MSGTFYYVSSKMKSIYSIQEKQLESVKPKMVYTSANPIYTFAFASSRKLGYLGGYGTIDIISSTDTEKWTLVRSLKVCVLGIDNIVLQDNFIFSTDERGVLSVFIRESGESLYET